MKQSCTILVSNTPLPAQKIGSWTTRIDQFNKVHDLFDVILSPNAHGNRYLYCQKRKFLTWQPAARASMLRYWVAKDYLKELGKLAKSHSRITVVVMDDLHLLEAVAGLKKRLKTPLELIFSFHGFRLTLNQKLQQQVNKVLFLSKLGHKESQKASSGFLPKAYIVGNAVSSQKFFPALPEEKIKLRASLAISESEKVFIWMANDRPIKGLAMYRRIAEHYSKNNAKATFLVIGNTTAYNDGFCTYLGKIPNDKIGSYLQVGDFYLFTALTQEGFGLSIIEAYKCGNYVVAPKTGAIPEILEGLTNCCFVNDPTNFTEWTQRIDSALNQKIVPITKEQAAKIWPYHTWEQKFLTAITSDS